MPRSIVHLLVPHTYIHKLHNTHTHTQTCKGHATQHHPRARTTHLIHIYTNCTIRTHTQTCKGHVTQHRPRARTTHFRHIYTYCTIHTHSNKRHATQHHPHASAPRTLHTHIHILHNTHTHARDMPHSITHVPLHHAPDARTTLLYTCTHIPTHTNEINAHQGGSCTELLTCLYHMP